MSTPLIVTAISGPESAGAVNDLSASVSLGLLGLQLRGIAARNVTKQARILKLREQLLIIYPFSGSKNKKDPSTRVAKQIIPKKSQIVKHYYFSSSMPVSHLNCILRLFSNML